ncbi:MAG TPA: hypothetical protein VH740_02555 [Vicinamibacterales bacterium]|jgi:hypothetical protein
MISLLGTLVDFSLSDISRALRNLEQSGSRYLLTTIFIERNDNPTSQQANAPAGSEASTVLVSTSSCRRRCASCLYAGGTVHAKRIGLWRFADQLE